MTRTWPRTISSMRQARTIVSWYSAAVNSVAEPLCCQSSLAWV